jgi:hypothetical protein
MKNKIIEKRLERLEGGVWKERRGEARTLRPALAPGRVQE